MTMVSLENQTSSLIDAMASFARMSSASVLADDKPLDFSSVLLAANL